MRSLIVDTFACYRVTRLVTTDKITDAWREHALARIYSGKPAVRAVVPVGTYADSSGTVPGRVIAFDSLAERVAWEGGDAPKLAQLLLCPWCVSVYVGFGIAVARKVAPRAWPFVAESLTLSALTGIIAHRVGD